MPNNKVTFERNEHVEIVVRTFGVEGAEYIEIRERIKAGEVYGHGIILPKDKTSDLITALQRVEGL